MNRDELLIRRLHAQHLLAPAAPKEVCAGLCGLQAQFLRNAVHALRIRTDRVSLAGLVKTWTLRGTVHLVPEDDLPLYIRHCGGPEDVCLSGWYGWTQGRGHANPPEREIELARMLTAAIADGTDTREALRLHLRERGMTEAEEAHTFNPWGGLIAELANVGALAFRVEMQDDVHPDETKRYRLLPPFQPLDEKSARLELARRYFTHYGPATLRDAAYFFHWTQKEVKALLAEGPLPAELPVCAADCEGRTYYWIGPQEPMSGELPEVKLLAGFDPLMMGYCKEENPFLPKEHLRGIFNLAGIVNPAILLHGRVVGKWKEKDGKVELTAFERINAKNRRLIERECARLFTVKKLIWK